MVDASRWHHVIDCDGPSLGILCVLFCVLKQSGIASRPFITPEWPEHECVCISNSDVTPGIKASLNQISDLHSL